MECGNRNLKTCFYFFIISARFSVYKGKHVKGRGRPEVIKSKLID